MTGRQGIPVEGKKGFFKFECEECQMTFQATDKDNFGYKRRCGQHRQEKVDD